MEAWDAARDDLRFANIYEYTWLAQPETLETEPEYGPIEYFDGDFEEPPSQEPPSQDGSTPPQPEPSDSTSGETIGKLLLLFVPLYMVVVIIVMVIIIIIRKKKNKHDK